MENKTGPVFTIREFCAEAKFSEPLFYKRQRLGIGPRTASVGRRKVVTETPREYYARLEAESASVPTVREAVD
jgi:hypothetical protein